jgi:cobalt-zinc-cadmium efflux system protein
MERWSDEDRFLAVLWINVIVVIAELWVGWSSKSLSLTSDGFHGLLHVFTSIVALFSVINFRHFSKEQIKDWAFKINVAMFFPLAIFIAYEAIHRLIYPEKISLTSTFFLIALGGALANFWAERILHGKNISKNRMAFHQHMRYDLISSIIVIFGAIIIKLTDWYVIDPIASFVLAYFIIIGAKKMFSESNNCTH